MIRLGISATGRAVTIAAPLRYMNRHALIAGASGTGKTTSLGAMAEALAAAGTPCLVVDAKGDLEGLTRGGAGGVWDPFGERGTPRRLDLGALGPELLTRALDLSEAQGGALDVVTEVARIERRDLSTLGDLRYLLAYCGQNKDSISDRVGLVSASSLAAVQRALLPLQRDAAGAFGLPALDIGEAEAHNADETGRITVLAAARLTHTPGLYGALCAYLLSDLFTRCPEAGDLARPRLALFLDEAHLIFDGASPRLVARIAQMVRLIRSKGVCVVFATQAPGDLPDAVAGQLQTRIQHGLRASTPAQHRALKAAADSMPAAPGFDAVAAMGRLGVGEALVSVLDAGGQPMPSVATRMHRPRAVLSPLDTGEILIAAIGDGLALTYEEMSRDYRSTAPISPTPADFPDARPVTYTLDRSAPLDHYTPAAVVRREMIPPAPPPVRSYFAGWSKFWSGA